MPDGVLQYTTVSTVMRPPRLAILFRGDANWRRWARLALGAAGATWAGGGHMLVPYDRQGQVSPALIDVVKAFDPDHVVLLTYTMAENESIEPGEVSFTVAGETVTGDKRAQIIVETSTFRQPDPAGNVARRAVVEACTPFVTQIRDDETHELQRTITSDGDWNAGLPASDIVDPSTAFTAVPKHWPSNVALFASALLGLDPRPAHADHDPEPEASEILRYVLSQPRPAPPSGLVATDPSAPSSMPAPWFETIDVGVATIARGYSASNPVVVLGDTADDFALAVAAHRLRGSAIWVTSDMVRDKHALGYVMHPLVRARDAAADDVVFTSASFDDRATEAFEGLRDQLKGWFIGDDDWIPEKLSRVDWSRGPHHFRAVGEAIGQLNTVPVVADASGTLTMATRFPLPAPRDAALTRARPRWYVDVAFDESTMPTGRGLRPAALRGGHDPVGTNVRTGRDGLSVIAQSYGFVPAGAVLSAAMARPVLRDLGMFDWTKAQATAAGLSARYSTPGQHAQLVATRLGSRDALIDLLSGPMRPALICYREGATPTEAQGAASGSERIVLLDHTPYLTLARMAKASAALSIDTLRSGVDDLCRQGLARRGLILRCTDCGRGSFISLEDLAQRFTCPRCATRNNVSAWSWRTPTSEPSWYYDLHASLREIITTSGDIPLLAAAHLRKAARRYADCAEIEFSEDGSPVAEVDLIAHADGQVILVEAKAGASLGRVKKHRLAQAAKLARIARALKADEILLATTQAAWPAVDVHAVEAALGDGVSGSMGRPAVRALVGLGSDASLS